MSEQEFQDLKEFLTMLDFDDIGDEKIRIVSNVFELKELPATVQNYIEYYLQYLSSVQ